MSCSYESCCPGRQPAYYDQAPSISGHTASMQPNKAQITGSYCHACSPHPPVTNCCSCGCPCHHSPAPTTAHPRSPDPHVCPSFSHHHHHQPPVASPLLYSHHHLLHHHHPLQTTPTDHNPTHMSKLHPSLEPSPLCQSISRSEGGSSVLCLSKSHGQLQEWSPICQSSSHPSLERSPLSRPYSRVHLHPSTSYYSRPHREKFTPESTRFGSKLFPPSLEFSPEGSEYSSPTSKAFQLGIAAGSTAGKTLSPKKVSSPNKITNRAPQAPVIVADVQGDVPIPPTSDVGPSVSDPQVEVLEVQPTVTPPTSVLPTKAVSRSTRSKGRSPVLLYNWCFKVMSNRMVILLGYKSQDSDELKWRSGPVSERLSSTLLMTKSGQLYHLMGLLCHDEMNKESPELNQQTLKKFKRGFPSKWEDILFSPKFSSVPQPKENSFKQPATPELASDEKKPSNKSAAPSKKRVKKEVPDDPLQMMTPIMTESAINTPRSSFVDSLKRSSRGRTLKPARSTVSPCLATCDDLYTYDWHGNFQGIASSVIDLTLCDDPLPQTKKRTIKKEPVEKKTKPKQTSGHANKNVVPHTADAMPTSVAPPTVPMKQKSHKTTKDAVGSSHSTVPAKRRKIDKKSTVVSDEISILDPDHNDLDAEPSSRQRKSAYLSSSDKEELSESETVKQRKGNKTRKSTKTRNKSAAAVRESNAETIHVRQSVPTGKSREKNINRERTAPGANVGHKDGQPTATAAKPITSSAGGKEKRRRVRMTLSSEEESEEGEVSGRRRQQSSAGGHSQSRSRRMYNMETASDESEVEVVNDRGRPMSVVSPRQPAPAKKEQKMSKTCVVRLSDSMKGFSPLKRTLSSMKKKSREETEDKVRTSSSTGSIDGPKDDKMTESELRNLRQVVHGVPALTTNFWEVVAQRLKTGHTAHQCCSAYHKQRGKMKPPAQRPRNKEKPKSAAEAKVTKVTGGTGTLKRKRQLRDALEEMDKGYYDDIFDSTPFKKIKKSVTIPESDDDNFEGEENSLLEGEESNTPRFLLCYTPSTAQSRVGAPVSQTPNLCDYLTTPDLKSGLKRDVADHVIYKAQKAPRGGGKKRVSFQKPLTSSSSSSKPFVFEQKLHNIRTGEMTTLRMFEDSDDSSSDSDDSNPFEDVLAMI